MRIPWKLVGLAGVAGVAATGAVVVRRRRAQEDLTPEDLRERLRARLAAVPPASDGDGPPPAAA